MMALNPNDHEACIQRISEKGKISAAQALSLLREVADRAERMRASGEADPFVSAAAEMADTVKAAAVKQRTDALRNAAIRDKIIDQVDTGGGIKTALDTLRSILHGTNIAGRDSVQAQWRGLAAGWQAQLTHQLVKGGVEKVAISGALDREIASEMWAINQGVENERPVSAQAKTIAQAYQPLLEHMRLRLNAVGAEIGDAADYVAHTLHDPEKMRWAAGFKATPDESFASWWGKTEPKLSDKTFEGVTPEGEETEEGARARLGRSVYDALVSGVHMTPQGAFGIKDEGAFTPASFEGTHNIARKVSKPRVLFWKSGEDWNDYMEEFSNTRSLTEGVMRTVDKSARQLALMDKLGTNPAANLNQIIRRIEEKYRPDLDGVKKFQQGVNGIQNVMAHLDGSANIPANEMAAKIGSSIRTWESVSMLGGVGITHFASVWPTVTSEMVHHGVSRLESLGNMVGALVKGKGSAEHQEIMADLGAYSHGLTRDMYARWQADDPVPGKISALASTFMKYTGIHYIFDNTQAAVREMLAHQLGRNTSKEFGALEPHLSQMIGKYGIGKDEWNLLRAVPDLPSEHGYSYMTPKEGIRTDPAAVESLLRSRGMIDERTPPEAIATAVQKFQQSLSDKLLGYYGDAAAHSVVTAGVRERAAILGGTRPGTLWGEAGRYLAQFKMWPLAAMNQVIGREIYTSLSKGEATWNLGIMAALSMSAGYVRMSVNDLATGRPVRNPLDPRTMAAALAQGGGVGILGDFLFGETNRMGGGIIGTLGGPVASDADSLVKLFEGWKNGSMGWPDLAHFAVRHVPFANLVYLKGALDYMLWYHLYEAASPGWWERTNRRLAREQGRTMTGYAPGKPIPWTPWGS